jgi:hypothetical protein
MFTGTKFEFFWTVHWHKVLKISLLNVHWHKVLEISLWNVHWHKYFEISLWNVHWYKFVKISLWNVHWHKIWKFFCELFTGTKILEISWWIIHWQKVLKTCLKKSHWLHFYNSQLFLRSLESVSGSYPGDFMSGFTLDEMALEKVNLRVFRVIDLLLHKIPWAGIEQSVWRRATGWTVRGSNPGASEILRTFPDQPWVQPSLLYNGYRVFPGG